MNVLVPCVRLLIAAALLILVPASAAAGAISPFWLLAALVPVTVTSCVLQDLRGLRHVLACAASNAIMMGLVYVSTLAGLRLAAAL